MSEFVVCKRMMEGWRWDGGGIGDKVVMKTVVVGIRLKLSFP